jgi:galactokinase
VNGKALLERLNTSRAAEIFTSLYGANETGAAKHRYASLIEGLLLDSPQGFPSLEFPETTGDLRIFTAAGRTELGGNHTDHNRGKVLAASIQLDSVAIVAPRKDRRIFFRSVGYPDVSVDLADVSVAAGSSGALDIAPRPQEKGTTEALVRGIAAEFAERGASVGGFTANAASTVLSGSGLSSSAAVEVLLGKIFDTLYWNGKCTALEIAQIGQKAENIYFGKPSGLMDQTACASGGAVAIDFADQAAPIVTNIPFDPLAAGFILCVVNTRGSHADLTPDYAAIPLEMKTIARFFGKPVLREIDRSMVLSHAGELRKAFGDRAFLRALHFFNENDRVDAMLEALKRINAPTGNEASAANEKRKAMAEYLHLVNVSGDSSWELLQNIYSPQKPAEQSIAAALALTKEFFHANGGAAASGACRVHGGGFAGTIQAYIPADLFEAYRAEMETQFGSGAVTVLQIRSTGAAELQFN